MRPATPMVVASNIGSRVVGSGSSRLMAVMFFPHPWRAAAVEMMPLAICNIEDKRARAREKERGRPPRERRAAGRLVEGQDRHL